MEDSHIIEEVLSCFDKIKDMISDPYIATEGLNQTAAQLTLAVFVRQLQDEIN